MVFAIEKTGIKYKKKKWIQIQSPKLFGEKVVGETLVGEVDKMLGSTVLVSVGQLTGNVKKQNLIVTLKITGFDGDKAKTDIKEFKLEKSYIARLVKKRASQLTDSFAVESKDKKKVRVKPILVTRSKVKGSVSSALQVLLRKTVTEYIQKNTFIDIVSEVINFKMQVTLKSQFDKIHPIKTFQIKYVGLEK